MTTCQFLASLVTSPLADIPPPPPEIPIFDVAVPHPIAVLVAGLILSLAMVLVGLRRNRSQQGLPVKNGGVPAKFGVVAGIVIAIGTCGAALWAKSQWRDYELLRDRWRPNGPVGEHLIPPVDRAEVSGVPDDDQTAAADPTSGVVP